VHRAGQRVARCWLCGRAAGPCCHSRRPASRAQVHSSGVAMSGRARMCRMARSQRLYITHQRCGAVWRAGCGRACLRVGHPEQALRLGHLLVQRGELPPQHARLRARARLHRPGSARRALFAGRGGGASAARARGPSLGAAGQCDVAPTGALHASQRVSAECACPPRGDEGRRAPQERYWLPNAGPHAYAQRVCAAAHVRSQASAGGSAAHAGAPSPPFILARTWAALPRLHLKPDSTTTRAAAGPWPYLVAHLVQLDLRVHGRHVCIQRVRIRGRLGAAARGRRGAAGRPLPARGAARVVLCPVREPGASPGNLGRGRLGVRQSRGRSLRRSLARTGGWASAGGSRARDSRSGGLLSSQRVRQRHALAQQRLLPRRRCGAQRARVRAQRAGFPGARSRRRTPRCASHPDHRGP